MSHWSGEDGRGLCWYEGGGYCCEVGVVLEGKGVAFTEDVEERDRLEAEWKCIRYWDCSEGKLHKRIDSIASNTGLGSRLCPTSHTTLL